MSRSASGRQAASEEHATPVPGGVDATAVMAGEATDQFPAEQDMLDAIMAHRKHGSPAERQRFRASLYGEAGNTPNPFAVSPPHSGQPSPASSRAPSSSAEG